MSDHDSDQRIDEIHSEFRQLEHEADVLIDSLETTKNRIFSMEADDRNQISTAADTAYARLENVASGLVSIDSGSFRLSKSSEALLTMIAQTAQAFCSLSEISKSNAHDLGIATGDCEELRHQAQKLISMLDLKRDQWNLEYGSSRQQSENQFSYARGYADKQGDLDGRAWNAEREVDDMGNQIASWFSGERERELKWNVDNARRNRDHNRDHCNKAKREAEGWYRQSLAARNGGSACVDLRGRLQATNLSMGNELARVVDAQMVESKLWSGLLELNTLIEDNKFNSTRDSSLRTVLQLLQADDGIFGGVERYAATEHRIKAMVEDKLGPGTVERILDPKSGTGRSAEL